MTYSKGLKTVILRNHLCLNAVLWILACFVDLLACFVDAQSSAYPVASLSRPLNPFLASSPTRLKYFLKFLLQSSFGSNYLGC